MVIAILFLPALIAMAMLNSMSAPRVLIRVYVPCLMFIPVALSKGLGGFILTDTAPLVLLLGGVGLVQWRNTLKFTFVDACVVLFAFSAFYADAHQRPVTIGLYVLCQNLSACTLPYLVGRCLIEQTGSRKDFVRTLVFCLAIVGFVSLYEYRMQTNVFSVAASKISGLPSVWVLQTRWGFARIGGPYGGSIIAAMMFSTGLLLQLWLAGTKSWENFKGLRFFRASRRAKAVTLGVCLGLFMTQSRGPWIGCGFGLIIASIGFAKNRRRAATFAITGLIVALLVTSITLDKYSSSQAFKNGTGGETNQQTAAYRRNLIPLYEPLIAEGGIWGWGTPQVRYFGEVGYIKGQTSIDNEYIRLAMAQGYFGLGVFILILIASMWRAARFCATFRARQDVMFAYCMLGTILALSLTISTVALLDPMTQVAFILFGWTQSLRPTGNEQESLAPVATGRFAFKRVFA